MRRRCLSALLVALVIASASPAFGADPVDPTPPSVEPNPTAELPPTSEPSAEPDATPSTDPGANADPEPSRGPVDPDDIAVADLSVEAAGHYIVILKPNADAARVRDGLARKDGVRADRVFDHLRAFSAKLDGPQRAALKADPSVAAVVPDEIIELAAQTVPTGIKRVGARSSITLDTAGDGSVDADIAIVDTGIDATHPDLDVRGGINCSSTSPNSWRDRHGHGTHVAGIAAARDDDYGVVGVAPGARLWAVKILNDSGIGLLSWYVCGLDWIAAQKDPDDDSRQLIEVVNMSVAKSGSDDRNCGFSNSDILHQAICRLTDTGITVIAAAANESRDASHYVPAAYDEVITVSALADTDGKPGGLGSPTVCGSYNTDDTFARFSNYGADVDLMAPGKCIRSTLPSYSTGIISGTSMAAPHVAGAVALYKATRPWATTAETLAALLDLGSFDYATGSDPDGRPDVLLDVSRLGPYGDFDVEFARSSFTGAPGGSATMQVAIDRSTTHVELVTLSATGPFGFELGLNQTSTFGGLGVLATLSVAIPLTASPGNYTITIKGTEHGRTRQDTAQLVVSSGADVGSRLTAIDPVRLLDTRVGQGLSGAFQNSVVRTFQIAGRATVPANAVAVTGNLTVVGQTSDGYVALGPSVSSTPTTSTLNVPRRDIRAVGVTVALSSEGRLAAVWKGSGGSTAHLIFDVTGYFLESGGALTYRATSPARLLDTRASNGLSGPFRASVVRTVLIAGRGGIPADAVAVTANLTVTDQTSAGYGAIGPTMTSSPGTSTLNIPRGDVRANSTTVMLSSTGRLGLVWKGPGGSTAHLILDITGYFTESASGATFHPMDPERIVDSRSGIGIGASLPNGTVRTFNAIGSSAVPDDAIALTGILTITNQSRSGFLALGPTLSATPRTSSLNAPRGDNRANGFVVLVDASGRLGLVWMGGSGTSTHVIVDVTGYYR